jgi:antitoxin PrlF
VPAEVREQVGAAPGTRLVWHVLPDGSIIVRAKTKSILDMTGTLKAAAGQHVKVKDMQAWR